jgi:hypothetical protein
MPLGSLMKYFESNKAQEAVAGGVSHPKWLTEFMKKRERDYSKEGILFSSIGSICI